MTNNYINPNKELIKYTCPHCNTISQMVSSYHLFQDDPYKEPNEQNILTIHKCQCCGNKIIWVGNKYVYPDIIAEEANPDMPKSVRQLYDEAGLIYNKSPRAACALLRLAIDKLCNELGETDRDINNNIGALVKKGLSKQVQQALDLVRVIGNKAVHPGQIAFDVDDIETAKKLMHLVNIIVQRMITEPNEISSMFEKLPENAKSSIEKRDN